MNDIVDRYPFCFKGYTPILPLVYSDALSYIETLGQFANKLNEVVDRINNVTTDAVEMANAYTDTKVAEQTQLVKDAVRDVRALVEDVEEANRRFIELVNARLVVNENKINNFQEQLTADINAVNQRTDFAIQQNNEYLLSVMPEFLSQIKVRNYFTGESVSIQDMFDYMAQFHLTNAISVGTLVARQKTVNQLIAYNMTMTDLATNGGTIIKFN